MVIFRYSEIRSGIPFPFRVYRVGGVWGDGELLMMTPQTCGSGRKWSTNGVRFINGVRLMKITCLR